MQFGQRGTLEIPKENENKHLTAVSPILGVSLRNWLVTQPRSYPSEPEGRTCVWRIPMAFCCRLPWQRGAWCRHRWTPTRGQETLCTLHVPGVTSEGMCAVRAGLHSLPEIHGRKHTRDSGRRAGRPPTRLTLNRKGDDMKGEASCRGGPLSFSIHACIACIEQNPLRSGSPFECVLSPPTFKSMCTASTQNSGFEEEKRPKKF